MHAVVRLWLVALALAPLLAWRDPDRRHAAPRIPPHPRRARLLQLD